MTRTFLSEIQRILKSRDIGHILRTALDFQTIKADFLLKRSVVSKQPVTYTLRVMRAFSPLRKADSFHTRTHARTHARTRRVMRIFSGSRGLSTSLLFSDDVFTDTKAGLT
ncbi:hypothetical protein DPX16_13100 [Anabarilius grahami]|uniref:Uncharacterized protein n=1 Tax=Anabarilius grahami TaxID=495550 RepID=A0A3N0YME3_ANAGA|nr:hypothetical protein DPX16_13100 [Anabarilius grahami]